MLLIDINVIGCYIKEILMTLEKSSISGKVNLFKTELLNLPF